MKLNAEHLEILAVVRSNLKSGFGSKYICCQIDDTIANKFRVESVEDDDDALKMAHRFKDAVHSRLSDQSTLFIYMRRTIPGFQHMDLDVQANYTQLARIAWVDKMIEAHEII